MKRKLTLLCAVILALAVCAMPALAAGLDVSDSFYVNDAAGVLTDDTKNEIIGQNGNLEYYCDGAQIVVVTIDFLPSGYDSEQYANLLFNDWGVGSAEANNGLLLLLVTEEARGWVAVGAGISASLSEDYINDTLNNYFWDYVDAGEYDTAVSTVFPQFLSWFESHYGVSFTGNTSGEQTGDQGGEAYVPDNGYYPESGYDDGYSSAGSFITTVIFIFVVVFIIAVFAGNSVGRRRYYNSYGVWPAFFFFGGHNHRPPRYGPGPHNPFDPNGPPMNNGRNDRDDHWGGGSGFGSGGHSGGFGGGGFGGGGGHFGGGGGFGGGGHSSGGGGGRH